MRPKRIIIDAPAAPATFLSKEEEPTLKGDDIITSLTSVPAGELTKEEQLALALEASKDTALEAGGPGNELHLR